MGGGGCSFSADNIVIKSPNDRRLYRVIQLDNGLSALLVHDPEIYPDGPPDHENSEAEDMECEDDGDGDETEDGSEEEEDEDDEEEDDEDEEGEDNEQEDGGDEGKGKGKGGASQTKKVCACLSHLNLQ